MAVFLALSMLAASHHPVATSTRCSPRREVITVTLGDFLSRGEIARPPKGTPTHALAILFGGSDVADLDSAIVDGEGHVIARPMGQVAARLACAGIASLRYNKRFVTSTTSVDRVRFDRLNGTDLAADGQSALARARIAPDLAGLPTALIGWSEGSTVAMEVAHREPSIRAVVLLAPVVASPAVTAQVQYARIGRPYLRRYAIKGGLDSNAVSRAKAGPGGVLAQIFVHMFEGFRPGERLNPLLDTNHDGRITFDEADPIIASWYADTPNGGLGIDATGRALPGLEDSWRANSPPVFILQGRNDAMIDPGRVTKFVVAHSNNPKIALRLYSSLGHGLGFARSPIEDGLRPIANRPLLDMAQWLLAKFSAEGR